MRFQVFGYKIKKKYLRNHERKMDMKKSKVVVLIFCLLFSLTSCGVVDQATAYNLVKSAVEKTDALDSVALTLDLDMELSMTGETMQIPMKCDVLASGLQSDEPVASCQMTSTVLGQTIAAELYADKEYLYLDQMGQKIKIATESDQASAYEPIDAVKGMFKALPKDVLKDVGIVANDDGSKSVTVKLSGEVFEQIYSDFSKELIGNALTQQYEGAEISFDASDAQVAITVTDSGYIGRYELAFTMNYTVVLTGQPISQTVDATVKAEFIDPGKPVTVTAPDLTEYTDYADYMSQITSFFGV